MGSARDSAGRQKSSAKVKTRKKAVAARAPKSTKTSRKPKPGRNGEDARSVAVRPRPVDRTLSDRVSDAAKAKKGQVHSGKYVYCIVRSSDALQFGAIGIGAKPAEVHTVNYKSIAAVVSDTPIELHDPTRENVLAHERVNETVMRRHTVIPMSFGTVFKTREDIIELLRSAYDAF